MRAMKVSDRYGVLRGLLALLGVAVIVTCLVHLIEVDNRAAKASPWWLLGLSGVAMVVVALGSPRAGLSADDGRQDAEA